MLRFDFLEKCPDINPGPPGRPSFKVEINFRNPLKEMNEIKKFCEYKESKKSTQTEKEPIQTAMEATESMTGCEKSFLFSNIWTKINLEDQVKMLFLFYNDFD